MKRLRPLAETIAWQSFRLVLALPGNLARRWKRVIAAATMGIGVARAIIWIAKAVASAGTVDQALVLVGLGEYVRPFEEAVDTAIAMVLAILGVQL